jgi:hypothetical protein
MKRTAFIVFVLAALIAISANGSPVRPAKSHKNAPAAASRKSSNKTAPHPAAAKAKHARAVADEPATAHIGTRKASRATSQKVARANGKNSRSGSKKAAAAPPCVAPAPAPTRSKSSRPASSRPVPSDEEPARALPAVESEATAPPVAEAQPVSLHRKQSYLSQPLRGSYESLVRQNQKTEADGLERILDDDDLTDRIARKMLVSVPASSALIVNPSLPENRRYCRPWTANFLADLARAHAAQFRRPVIVSSAVRTVEYQKRLMGTNGNAAAAEGDIASPHLTGATIDIAKQGLSRKELAWMRAWLVPLIAADQIDVEEEFQQACFHITVYKSYVPAVQTRKPRQKQQRPSPSTQLASRGR